MAVKYQDYLHKMYEEHKEMFDAFESVHHAYQLDRARWQNEFNDQGRAVMRIVEEWENKLCGRMEKGKHRAYSHRLADKFRAALRERFLLIDFVGTTVKVSRPLDDFVLPKINLD